jgi:hypothetical protein
MKILIPGYFRGVGWSPITVCEIVHVYFLCFFRVLVKILMPAGSKDIPVGKALCVIVSLHYIQRNRT